MASSIEVQSSCCRLALKYPPKAPVVKTAVLLGAPWQWCKHGDARINSRFSGQGMPVLEKDCGTPVPSSFSVLLAGHEVNTFSVPVAVTVNQ